jgi:hypothetical protein
MSPRGPILLFNIHSPKEVKYPCAEEAREAVDEKNGATKG